MKDYEAEYENRENDVTVAEARKWASDYLKRAKIENYIKEADFLLAFILDWDRSKLLAYPEKHLSSGQYKELKELVIKRSEGTPYAYLTGKREFMGLEFTVTENVLIPRPDTEVVVEFALNCLGKIILKDNPNNKKELQFNELNSPIKILDICTGSGNIGLSIAYYFNKMYGQNLELTLSDISDKALEIAHINASNLGLLSQCKFVKSDLFSNTSDDNYRLITANPPYISSKHYSTLSKEVKLEPAHALLAGEDGLYYYKKISQQIKKYLSQDGVLIFEIGEDQQEEVENMLSTQNLVVTSEQDLAGRPRLIAASRGYEPFG
ncbi:peptide chain release factor N(5)-glutamine methyltransferase [Natranaerobius thermophilus]|uniref:Release factor glutamine methyltransferase n=1 Tax=Natranaerobius thermophilus (strain ATCC BAA-1301 / DSM 18059 / JW/NM-WN-LF) TaxID=457570 RepID=B2A3I9_NATTJ|nr:peptide chain release factor N(5)-glutamine methyltransferase [Natranaerobius thermophilus]ACB86418.1 protein-(glutamine-N5) methyltransferase, release factor-specific [Natranaerobius thermophilus JW/NM-WN-LF]